ncbi:MAG: NGG1p interacting factor NIF3 [Candidatus Omnitrophica bacterium]|nr:NGG1p interacting factor NIF3 [Candidatus Omnitrophota bacterium]
MKLCKLYDLIIEKGIAADPRGKKCVEKELKKIKKDFEALSEQEKKEFDQERFVNPYSDSRLLVGSGDEEIRRILVGIDIDVAEILLADRLSERGTKIDLVLSHHPEGRALASLYEVMPMQADLLAACGVPITVAESLMEKRIQEVERRVHPVNHMKTVDAARLLAIPLICAHTPADNQVCRYLQQLFDEKEPETLSEILNILKNIPEYRQAVQEHAGPKIVHGSPKSRSGKIMVDMTGGTEGAKDIFKNLSAAGIGTIVGMHVSEEHLQKAREAHINVVIAGHIASDAIGLNLLLDELESKQKLNIVCCSGFTRVKRT